MSTIRQELPFPIRQSYLPPEHFFEQQQDSSTIDATLVLQHLSTYLQIFPHQAAIVSSYDNSLPLHFAASLGDASIAQVVWQAVSTTARVVPLRLGECEMQIAHALYSSLSLSRSCYVRNYLILPSSLRFPVSLSLVRLPFSSIARATINILHSIQLPPYHPMKKGKFLSIMRQEKESQASCSSCYESLHKRPPWRH